jgi:hypothetical protein
MKKIVILTLAVAALFTGCRSLEITNFEVLSNKDNKIIYRVDAVENGIFSSRQVLGLVCVADSKGDLVCR